jgi:S1-C subfamily serine protease
MKKALYVTVLSAVLFLSSCAFTNLFTKNLLDQRRRSFIGLTKMIFTADENKQMVGMSTASGAVVGHHGDKSYILTAKHFCDSEGDKWIDVFHAHTQKAESTVVKILAKSKKMDACILESPRLNLRKLSIANSQPEIGEKVYNMAAPQGIFGEDLVLLYEGFFSGVLKGDGLINPDADIYSQTANPGSSGSPIIDGRGKLVGMVWAIHSRFHHITLSIPFEGMKNFIISNIPQE